MTFLLDRQELKTGLIIFRRGDVKHRNWYCRIRLPQADRYKTVCLKTPDVDAAKERPGRPFFSSRRKSGSRRPQRTKQYGS